MFSIAEKQTLREIIQEEFGVDLPISGGFGRSEDDIIKIQYPSSLAIPVEYKVLKYIFALGNKSWKVLSQKLCVGKDGQKYDILSVEIEDTPDLQREFYFTFLQ